MMKEILNTKTADLVTFTEEILNGKLHFLCNGTPWQQPQRTYVCIQVVKTIIWGMCIHISKRQDHRFFVQ